MNQCFTVNRSLTTLKFCGNDVYKFPRICEGLAGLSSNRVLRILGNESCNYVILSLCVDISGNQFGDVGAAHLSEMLRKNRGISEIQWDGNMVTYDGYKVTLNITNPF